LSTAILARSETIAPERGKSELSDFETFSQIKALAQIKKFNIVNES